MSDSDARFQALLQLASDTIKSLEKDITSNQLDSLALAIANLLDAQYRLGFEQGHSSVIEEMREYVRSKKEDPQPIGNCRKCGTPIYTEEGFCGVCS